MWTLPNLLTLSRIPLGLAMWLVMDRPWLVFTLMAAAGATDMLDGWIARRRGLATPSAAGSWLDPACDKIFIASLLLAVWALRRPPAAWIALVAARELVIVPLAVAYRVALRARRMRTDLQAGALGKAATSAQFLAVAAIVLGRGGEVILAAVAAAVGLLAAAVYVRRAIVPSDALADLVQHPPRAGR